MPHPNTCPIFVFRMAPLVLSPNANLFICNYVAKKTANAFFLLIKKRSGQKIKSYHLSAEMGTGSGPSLSTSINYQQYKLNKKRPLFGLILVEKSVFLLAKDMKLILIPMKTEN